MRSATGFAAHAAVAALTLAMLGRAGAAAANPWQLHCRSMPSERPAPQPLREAALHFFPWVHPAATALRSGPVYLVALSSKTAISRDGDRLDGAGYYLHRALIAITPAYTRELTIRGRRLGRPGHRTTLGFATNGATSCTVNPPDVSCGSRPLQFADALQVRSRRGWRIVKTELRIGRTGCFVIDGSGPGLHARIPLAVPGPDYGTSGW